jgi:hypothetical protein
MVLGGKQIAAPGIVAASTHGAPDDATELAADEHSLFWKLQYFQIIKGNE